MSTSEDVICFVDTQVYRQTGQPLTTLQRIILQATWQNIRKTYGQIAIEHSYSEKYIKQVAGPNLWQLLSVVFDQKITKANAHRVLERLLPANNLVHSLTADPKAYPQLEVLQADSSTKFIKNPTDLQCGTAQLPALPFKYPRGPIPIDSPFYIPRVTSEADVHRKLLHSGTLLRIKGPRELGKSSFLLRLLDYAKQQGCKTATINFQLIDREILDSLPKLLRWIAANLSYQLSLPPQLEMFWSADIGDKLSCTLYTEGYLLEQIQTPIVVAFEEVNQLFENLATAQEFFAMLRVWYENTQSDAAWHQLRMIMVQSTESYISLPVNQSPFNVGSELMLKPFTPEQVAQLAGCYPLNLRSGQIEHLWSFLQGHPYLVHLMLYHLVQSNDSFEQVLTAATTDSGIFHHHLHRHLWTLQQSPNLLSAFTSVLAVDHPIELPQAETFKLHSLGLVKLVGNKARLSCELYRQYFNERLKTGLTV